MVIYYVYIGTNSSLSEELESVIAAKLLLIRLAR
jgi:hypothetical protein